MSLEGTGTSGVLAASSGRRTIGDALSLRHNSLNFLRLLLALAVIVDHCVAFGAFQWWGRWVSYNRMPLGTLAVYGFFAISGYLIAGSALNHGPVRYLWQRFLRIFPAYWVCLILTAFVFGVIAWYAVPQTCQHFSCYLHGSNGPFQYVYRNALLRGKQTAISGTPRGDYSPFAWGVWNGSTWTLFYEFLCYLILLLLAAMGLLRRRLAVVGITGALVMTCAVISLDPALRVQFSYSHNWIFMNLLKFSAIFLVGSLIYLYRDWLPDSGWLALACTALFIVDLLMPIHHERPSLGFAASAIAMPVIGYPLLWLGAHLPFQRVGARNDYSYGIYIYAFPVSQLLAIWGVTRLGYLPYTALVVLATLPLAVGSWWIVEKRALRLKALKLRSRDPGSPPSSTSDLPGRDPAVSTSPTPR
jgi:peptidoglycan/LPS O-acetylase OafA/YrhL